MQTSADPEHFYLEDEPPDDGGAAFPIPCTDLPGSYAAQPGMSLLDWFAGQIASGMAAFSGTEGLGYSPSNIAGRSYQIAEAMLKARAARTGEAA